MTTLNPDTGKQLKINGRVFNQLVNRGWKYEEERLIPPNVNNYVFSIGQNAYLKRDTAAFRRTQKEYDVIDGILTLKSDGYVMGIHKRRIKIDSVAYNKLIGLGYTLRDGMLYYPEIFVPFPPTDGYQIPESLINTIENNNYTVMEISTADGQNLKIDCSLKSGEIRDIWYKTLSYDESCQITSIKLYTHMNNPVHFGPMYDGEKNCVIKCIEAHLQKYNIDVTELYDKYQDGVFEDDFEELSRLCRIRILVYINKKEFVYGKNRKEKAQLKLYGHNNHVTNAIIENRDKNIKYVNDLSYDIVDITQITNVIESLSTLYVIGTNDTEYRLKTEFGIDLEESNSINILGHYTKLFLIDNPLIRPISKYHNNLDAIHTIVQHGIHFRNSASKGLCLDLRGAYTNYEKFQDYTGFPSDLSSCVEYNQYNKQCIYDCEGFALIIYIDLFNKVPIERWVSFPYVRFKLSMGTELEIRYLMIGLNRVHLNTSVFDNLPKEIPCAKRLLHKVFGKFTRYKMIDSFITTDPIVASNYFGTSIYKKDNMQLYQCGVSVERVGRSYYPHITGYVQNYTEIEMERKYIELTRDNIRVYGIWVDGISVPLNTDLKKYMSENFHVKKETNVVHICQQTYVKTEYPIWYSERFNNIITNLDTTNFCITGCAGTGKSYNIRQLYKQMSNSIILVYTHSLVRNYAGLIASTIQSYVIRPQNQVHNIIIDEYSMIDQELFGKLSSDNCNIVIAGDIGQLPPCTGKVINTTNFHKINLTKIYRQIDTNFIKNLEDTRISNNLDWIERRVTIEEALSLPGKTKIICSIHRYIDIINEIGVRLNPNKVYSFQKISLKNDSPVKILLPNTHPDKVILKNDTPVRLTKTKKISGDYYYVNGDIGIIKDITDTEVKVLLEIYEVDSEIMVLLGEEPILTSVTPNNLNICYAETIHGVQGKTLKCNIVICSKRMWADNMAYVAASRAVNESQLYILEDPRLN